MYLIQATTTRMSATTTFEMPIALDSLYIPRVYANITTEFIADTFENLDLGTVDRVEAVPRDGDNTSYMAFVYFSSWNIENKAAVNLANRIKCPKPGESQARIVYDDPWYWILLPNKSEKKNEATNLTSEETVDILYDMIEDLQTRLLRSEEKLRSMERELCEVRAILFDPVPPSPPKLVRQIATAGSSPSYVPVPPCPPPIGGHRERICEPEQSIDLSNVLFPMKAPQLPPSPFVVEPMHFYSRLSVHLSLKLLAYTFGKNDVAIKRFEHEKCKFTCSYYYGYELTEFVVKMFSTGDDDEGCLIEFQRRSGDREGLFRIYDVVYSEVFDWIDDTIPRSSQSYDQYIPNEFRNRPSTTSTPINFTECMRSTIAKHIADGDNQLCEPAEKTEWFPTEEEVAEYREDRQRRRMEEANIPPPAALLQRQTTQWWPTEDEIENYPRYCEERSRALDNIPTTHITQQGNMMVDNMGLVHSTDDKHFWCDP